MATNVEIGGTAFLKVDGSQYGLRGAFKVNPQTAQKTGVAGADGVHGFTRKFLVPSIEADISDSGGLSLRSLEAVSGATVTLELGNGKVYILESAWFAADAQLDAVEGKFTGKFEGVSMIEVTA